MKYLSSQSDNYLWYLSLRGKQKEKIKTDPNTNFFPIFNGRNNKYLNNRLSNKSKLVELIKNQALL